MANEIKLVTYANSEVTPQNDAVLTNLEIASNGVIFGCNVTIKNASTLHINAGMGVVYGREFEIVDSDIPVSLSSSGTLLGQLYVHIDLANTSDPAQLLVDTGNSLTPLVDDPTMNITTGASDYQLATFTVDTSTLDNLVETFSIVQNTSSLVATIDSKVQALDSLMGNTSIAGIGDGTVTGAVSQLNTDLTVYDLLGSADNDTSGNKTVLDMSKYNYIHVRVGFDIGFILDVKIPYALLSQATTDDKRLVSCQHQDGNEASVFVKFIDSTTLKIEVATLVTWHSLHWEVYGCMV